jgi:hypothetical protein
MADQVSLNEMIEQIRRWQLESNNFRNDSWTQDVYRERLTELHGQLADVINQISANPTEESEEEEEKDQ